MTYDVYSKELCCFYGPCCGIVRFVSKLPAASSDEDDTWKEIATLPEFPF